MPTLFNRLYAYHKTFNVPLLQLEQRGELGKKIIARYMKIKEAKKYKRFTRVTSKEYDFKGAVINYPVEFRQEMDKLIKTYYKRLQSKKPVPSLAIK